MSDVSFLRLPDPTPQAQAMFQANLAEDGFVLNATRMWSHHPHLMAGLFDLIQQAADAQQMTLRQRGILVAATASTFGDAYCSLAWGSKLAAETDPALAAAVLRGDDTALTPPEQALARWARTIAADPHTTTAQDVQRLREAGWDDAAILAFTVFIGLRIALSTVNDALGARPDAEFRTTAPHQVLQAVSYGRPIAD